MVFANGPLSGECQFAPVYVLDVTIPEHLIDHWKPGAPSQVIPKWGFLINNGVCVAILRNQPHRGINLSKDDTAPLLV